MGNEFNFFLNFSSSKFKIKFAVVSRAVKVTRDNVVRGKAARGYVATRYRRRGSVLLRSKSLV
jgi:hypothetical protein